MRYERPELALIGRADDVVLGNVPGQPFENLDTKIEAALLGYDK